MNWRCFWARRTWAHDFDTMTPWPLYSGTSSTVRWKSLSVCQFCSNDPSKLSCDRKWWCLEGKHDYLKQHDLCSDASLKNLSYFCKNAKSPLTFRAPQNITAYAMQKATTGLNWVSLEHSGSQNVRWSETHLRNTFLQLSANSQPSNHIVKWTIRGHQSDIKRIKMTTEFAETKLRWKVISDWIGTLNMPHAACTNSKPHRTLNVLHIEVHETSFDI